MENESSYVKDAFHEAIIHKNKEALNPKNIGTKAGMLYELMLESGETKQLKFRLSMKAKTSQQFWKKTFNTEFKKRIEENEVFYHNTIPCHGDEEIQKIQRQAYAGLLNTKQFYHYAVDNWLSGDPNKVAPPENRKQARNSNWTHLFNRDIISVPDKWEYPWYATWDLAFHMIPFDKIDPQFAKEQLILMMREWYQHPNGQLPAYEWNFSDVNPPVHAWAVWRIYKMTAANGERDLDFLTQCFHKLLINFTWWVNRKDPDGRNLFSGGFLGLDNIGAFDRSRPLPEGYHLIQSDGTAWMAFFCSTMLSIALELAEYNTAYEGIASKFFEHFVRIAHAINHLGGTGLWNEKDGFFYDSIEQTNGPSIPIAVRSLVGLLPICAIGIFKTETLEKLPRFKKRMDWFLNHSRTFKKREIYFKLTDDKKTFPKACLSIIEQERLQRILGYLFDENEFLSPYGIRSLSKFHKEHPFEINLEGTTHQVNYEPGESQNHMFGGNSNWRGPIWFPLNFLIIEALEKYYHFYGDSLKVELPTGSGNWVNLKSASDAINKRLLKLFLPDKNGNRPIHKDHAQYYKDPHFKNHLLFYEFFHADDGRG